MEDQVLKGVRSGEGESEWDGFPVKEDLLGSYVGDARLYEAGLEEEEEEEFDAETELLMNLADGVDLELLLAAFVPGNEPLQELMLQNEVVIDSEVIRAKDPHGYSSLHLAASQGLTTFAEYLMLQVRYSQLRRDGPDGTAVRHQP